VIVPDRDHVACDAYAAHVAAHVWGPAGWTCRICKLAPAVRANPEPTAVTRSRYCGTCEAIHVGPCPKASGTFRGLRVDARSRSIRASRTWRTLAASIVAAHVRQYGWVCPGDGRRHRAHPSRDLVVDHIHPLSRGGPPFDRENLRVLCRGANLARVSELRRRSA
jgi:hypothetical protein